MTTNPTEYQARYTRMRRRELYVVLDAIKLERGCVDCGYRTHPRALDFDHRDPAFKDEDVAAMVRQLQPLAKILAEVEKCDVRCANCHRVRSQAEGHHARKTKLKRPLPPTLFDLCKVVRFEVSFR